MEREKRIQGGIFGLLVGDALGMSYEFYVAMAIPRSIRLKCIRLLDFAVPMVTPDRHLVG